MKNNKKKINTYKACFINELTKFRELVWVAKAISSNKLKAEWVVYISGPSGSDTYYSTFFTISRDNTQDQEHLHINSLEKEDSFIYYCSLFYWTCLKFLNHQTLQIFSFYFNTTFTINKTTLLVSRSNLLSTGFI